MLNCLSFKRKASTGLVLLSPGALNTGCQNCFATVVPIKFYISTIIINISLTLTTTRGIMDKMAKYSVSEKELTVDEVGLVTNCLLLIRLVGGDNFDAEQ